MIPTQTEAPIKHPNGDPRFDLIDRALKRFQQRQDALIEVLHTAQETFGYLDASLMAYVARNLKLPLSWVYGVASFYHFFTLKPPGEHSCVVCLGTACQVKRAADILSRLQTEFGITAGQTTPDGKLSLDIVRCPGNCASAPIMVVDSHVWGYETPQSALERVQTLISE
jgi:bidirectional [NiFe] hydrogenase diaphorase subunit